MSRNALCTLLMISGILAARVAAQEAPQERTVASAIVKLAEAPLVLIGSRLLDGATQTIDARTGDRLVLFWSVGCDGCIEQLRDQGPLLRQAMAFGLEVVTVALDPESAWPEAWTWIRRLALPGGSALGIEPGSMTGTVDPRFWVDAARLPHWASLTGDGAIAWSTAEAEESKRRLRAKVSLGQRGASTLDPYTRRAFELDESIRLFFADGEPGIDGGIVPAEPLETLCAPFADRRQHLHVAVCQELVGVGFVACEDWGPARRWLAAASRAYAASGDGFGHWLNLISQAWVEALSGSPRAGLSFLDEAAGLAATMRTGDFAFREETFADFARKVGIPLDWLPALAERGRSGLPRYFAEAAETITHTSRGKMLAMAEEPEAAHAALRSALDAAGGFDGRYAALPRVALGRLANEQGEFDAARSWLRLALELPHPSVIWHPQVNRSAILGELFDIAVAAGQLEEALRVSALAIEDARARNDRAALAIELAQQSRLLRDSGPGPDAAREVLLEARRVVPADSPCLKARIAYDLASLDHRAGRYGDAEREVGTALDELALCPELGTDLVSEVLRLASRVCRSLGDELCVENRQRQALAAARLATNPRHVLFSRATMDEASQGTPSRAFDALRAVAESSRDPRVREAASMVELIRPPTPEDDGFSISDYMPVEQWLEYEQQRAGAHEPHRIQTFGVEMVLRGVRAIRSGRLTQAEQLLMVAADRLRRAGHPDVESRARFGRGHALWRLGRREESVAEFIAAVDLLDELASDVGTHQRLATLFGSDWQSLYIAAVEALAATGDAALALRYSEKARARALLLQLGSIEESSSTSAGAGLHAEIAHLRVLIADQQAALFTAETETVTETERVRIEQQLAHARSALDELVLRQAVCAPPRIKAAPTVEITALQEALGAETSAVVFFSVPKHLIAWVIDREQVHMARIPWTTADAERVACLVGRVGRGSGALRGTQRMDDGCRNVEAMPEFLWKTLIGPIAARIRHQHVVLVQHGVLHQLPFAALRDPATGRFWIEDVTLSYAPSASALVHLRAGVIGPRALVLGTSAAVAEPLPWAENEAEGVARQLGTDAHVGDHALEALVWARASEVDVLHLAAHGYFEGDDPHSGRIALIAGEGHDGRIEVRELLFDLRLPTLDLVVLSACRTALGTRTRGDDVVGLVRAFMAAGAPTVIASLWPVDDRASAELMTDFYEQLRAGRSVGDALRHAQLARLRGAKHADPYYWAAFGLYGVAGSRFESAAN